MNMEKASSRLKELRIVGGFLDGFKYSFTDKLNCIIGARGTGKTTVLEFIRYGLNAMPLNPKAHKRIAALVEGNLRGGRIELTIETAEGITTDKGGGTIALASSSQASPLSGKNSLCYP